MNFAIIINQQDKPKHQMAITDRRIPETNIRRRENKSTQASTWLLGSRPA